MNSTPWLVRHLYLPCFGLLLSLTSASVHGSDWKQDDFRWMHGANYVPSYSATDVEMWLNYDAALIDRELAYAKKMGLNCVRIFLQSLVYDHDTKAFLNNFENFLSSADKHGLKVMPILFDSCFGVAPSLESHTMWVANPGSDRMDKKWWPESDAYATAVVSSHVGDNRIVMWDVMNEPTATHLANSPDGKNLIEKFVAHSCELVRKLDPTHPITVGVAKWDNQDVMGMVDVLSCHSYAKGVEAFRADVIRTRDQARAAGKPWIVTECCNPAAGSTYEMVMPVLRELGVGHLVWQLIIGRDQFNSASGLVYPDGTVRRIAQIEAVINAPAIGFTEKPDEEGLPIQHDISVKLAQYLQDQLGSEVSEVNWRERVTLVEALVAQPFHYGKDKSEVSMQVAQARRDYESGDRTAAFESVARLIAKAAEPYQQNPPKPSLRFPLTATIYRDVYGIPHIFADSEELAAYAVGRAQCEDMGMRVFHSLRSGIGRKAEVLGERFFESDRLMHLWRVPETSATTWHNSSARTKRMLQAFCDGLNDYRRAHPVECKDAFEVKPIHVIALFRWTDVIPSHGLAQHEANFAMKLPPPASDFPNQSSTWAIGPSRTASERPILFIDPHWPAEGQTSWWEYHVHVGRTQVGGFAFPGVPLVGLGYTNGVAWAGTAGGADSADVFELKINPQNADQYWYDGQWRDMVIRTVDVRVKVDSGDVEERSLRIRESIHGPVLLEKDGRVLVGAVCGVRDTTRLEQWLSMNRAQTTRELRDAFRMDQASWLNITYASRDGHFGYIQTGMCPKRGSGPYQMLGVVDGTRSETNWQGRIPFDELPQLHDPVTGWLQSCNTAANYVTEGQTIRQEDFPPGVLIGHYSADGRLWRGRGHRCFEVMPKMTNVTHHQARQFALETFAPAGPIWAAPLCAAYDAYRNDVGDADLSMKMMANAVRQWDYQVRKESIGATAFRYWRMEYGKLHPEALGPNEAFGAPRTEQEQRDAVQALRAAADYMKETFGSTLVPWGQLLRLRRGDLDLPLDGDVGFFGGIECMRATGNSAPGKDGRYVFSGGQVIPTVVELTDPIQVWSIVPYGQSRRPESRHFADQAPLFSEGRMRPAWHTWSQLRDHVISTKVLEYPQK